MKPILTYETPLTAEQSKALDLMLDGKNVFLTGEAGTGKSHLLQEFRNRCDAKNIVFLAPTGLAASNIKGQTIHSFCRLAPVFQDNNTIEDITDPKYNALLNAVDTIVIDEISMVRSDIFAAIDYRFIEHKHFEFGKQPKTVIIPLRGNKSLFAEISFSCNRSSTMQMIKKS